MIDRYWVLNYAAGVEHKWGLLVGIYRTIIEFFNNGKTFLESSKIQ